MPLGVVDAAIDAKSPARFGPLRDHAGDAGGLVERLRQFAPSDVSIVITGETGTGKEVVARAVHAASVRRGKPFVGVNCAAMPENLLEDELFGHVKGACTGADRDREGLLVQADGGTLLFDEVAEMSPAMQAKLLRVLELGLVRPVGRCVLAATHASLEAEVNRGAFREDLFWRICQVTVPLPPLRDRLLDLRFLVPEILADLGHPEMQVDDAVLRVLQARSWPGNIRELRNFLEVSLVGARQGIRSLEEAFRLVPQIQRCPQGPLESVMPTMRWLDFKREVKRRYYTALYGACRGNVNQMAQRAGMQRKAVRDALQTIGLDEGVDDDHRGDGKTT